MAHSSLLLAASLACGANSPLLARWLTTAGKIEHLDNPGVHRATKIPGKILRAFHYHQAQPTPEIGQWQLCSILSDQYPALLKTISDPPGVLYVRGNIALLSAPQFAIVGARGASTEGLGSAYRFSQQLSDNGFVVISGLALGIDSHAHKGALTHGRTIAVLGHGPDRLYPARNKLLAESIVAAGGALITEFPLGIAPRRENFPARNRIISGMSLATIVVEAAQKSGSLITARQALQQGREVFAIPGSIYNPLTRGCHQLLRDGANWLESLDDLRDILPTLQYTAHAADQFTEDPLLKYFISGHNSIDTLAERSGMSLSHLSEKLFALEMAGQIERIPGGYARRLA